MGWRSLVIDVSLILFFFPALISWLPFGLLGLSIVAFGLIVRLCVALGERVLGNIWLPFIVFLSLLAMLLFELSIAELLVLVLIPLSNITCFSNVSKCLFGAYQFKKLESFAVMGLFLDKMACYRSLISNELIYILLPDII